MTSTSPTAAILVIGDEILSGRTKDTNTNYLCGELHAMGIPVREARTIPDVEETIVETVNFLRSHYTYVFTTGGIGPTHDDITAQSIAKAFGQELIQNPAARAILEGYYKAEDLNEARLRMANTPAGAKLIENPISRAPGFYTENVFTFAGVPRIMQAMFDNVRPLLQGGDIPHTVTIMSPHTEGVIATGLGEIQKKFPDVSIGSYPSFKDGKPTLSLVLRATNTDILETTRDEVEKMLNRIPT